MLQLIDIISEKGVIASLQAETREEAVYTMLERLVESGRIQADQLDDLCVEIIKRETLGTTGIGHGVAIPHIKTAAVSDFVGVLAVSEDGVNFNSIDAAPVKVIILFLSPSHAVSGHLQLLSHIGGILRHQGYISLLKEAKTEADIVSLVKDAERMIFGIGPGGDEIPDDDDDFDADAIMA